MYRWSKCPGSVALSKDIKSVSSVYAEEGTYAHDVASERLEHYFFMKKPKTLAKDEEMAEAVDVYVSIIKEDVFGVKGLAPSKHVMIEHKFDLEAVHPGLFGTADFVFYDPKKKKLSVYDYKHGAGLPVEVENNTQLMYYGLGALLSTGFPCETVVINIVQPRCFHPDGPVRRWEISAMDLLEFSADLKDFAVATEQKDAPLEAGDHCRFCPASGVCPKLSDKALVLAKEEFSPTKTYDPAKLKHALDWLPTLEGWIKSVREFAYNEAQHGRLVPGYKMVQKRKSRSWRDEASTEAVLAQEFGLTADDMTTSKFKTVAQIEKLLDAKQKKWVKEADLVVSQSSGLAMVPESDKRPAALNKPQDEFKVIQ